MDRRSTLPLHTGREMPALGLGTWELTRDTAGSVQHALDIGYRMIDTAADYGTHSGIAEAIRRSGLDRDEIYLVAKVEKNDDAYEATHRYLGELDQDYADLMLIHRPPPSGVGEELWEGLIRAREEGLARDIGVSNYSAEQIERLAEATDAWPSVDQIEWTPFGWSPEMLEYCRQREIIIQAYSPLTRARRLDDDRLVALAAEYDRTAAQLLLRWNLQLEVVPLPKANRKDHQRENLGAFDFEISDAHMEELSSLNEHYSSLGTLPYV